MSDDSLFIGNNSLILCEAEMKQIVAWYLNEVLLRTRVTVMSVKSINNTQYEGFEIKIAPEMKVAP